MKRFSVLALFLLLAGCDTWQARTSVVSDVRTIEAPPNVIAAPCVDPKDVPPEFVSSMPVGNEDDPRYVKQRSAGADADLTWLRPRYAKARNLLLQCSQLPVPKEDK